MYVLDVMLLYFLPIRSLKVVQGGLVFLILYLTHSKLSQIEAFLLEQNITARNVVVIMNVFDDGPSLLVKGFVIMEKF